jgi:protein-tyrosine phosphatase
VSVSGGRNARPRRILAVCLGNYCRSPLAAAVLTALAGAGVEVRSAGLREKWAGQPASPLMLAAAAEIGFDLGAHVCAQVTVELIDWADTVLAMDRAVLAELREFADERAAGKLRCYLPDADVPDPFGQPLDMFRDCVILVREGAAQHLPEIVDER